MVNFHTTTVESLLNQMLSELQYCELSGVVACSSPALCSSCCVGAAYGLGAVCVGVLLHYRVCKKNRHLETLLLQMVLMF